MSDFIYSLPGQNPHAAPHRPGALDGVVGGGVQVEPVHVNPAQLRPIACKAPGFHNP
jgi:hypothetical protein